jgi:NAD(P)-dependent dehydrogenase (short-subunit alcohol dehydrogenase family)
VPYASAKAGLVGFTRCLATEVARYNILVNCVAPGPTFNPFLKKIYTEEQLQEKTARTLVGRGAETEEIANVVTFLASDEASYMTGNTVSVSGGSVLY